MSILTRTGNAKIRSVLQNFLNFFFSSSNDERYEDYIDDEERYEDSFDEACYEDDLDNDYY